MSASTAPSPPRRAPTNVVGMKNKKQPDRSTLGADETRVGQMPPDETH